MKNLVRSTMSICLLVSLNSFAAEVSANQPQVNATEKREKVIDQREANQEKRIEQGEKSGALTDKEAKRLEKEQQHIKKMEQKAEADGVVSGKEMHKIEKAQNKASNDIKRKKHNKRNK